MKILNRVGYKANKGDLHIKPAFKYKISCVDKSHGKIFLELLCSCFAYRNEINSLTAYYGTFSENNAGWFFNERNYCISEFKYVIFQNRRTKRMFTLKPDNPKQKIDGIGICEKIDAAFQASPIGGKFNEQI